ncbi:Imm26 family immunity protein [Streptomyces sp. NPDC059256]|uniref:Imm26 family immunity protein n=1 Tax=Streptomyces sp. NPDC059256 TaxID=3346794 RepID=UPI00367A1F24
MLRNYRRGDVLSISVTDEKIVLGQVIEKMRGNFLLAVFPDLLDANSSFDIESLELDEPLFLLETMDIRIKDGIWPIIGNRELANRIPTPEYKVWVEPPGEYRIQYADGRLGVSISPERASVMKLHKSYSPAVVEAALRGFHGFGPWRKTFDELAF